MQVTYARLLSVVSRLSVTYLHAYPTLRNPVRTALGIFTMQTGNNQGVVTVTDVAGRVVYCQNSNGASTVIDLSPEAEGLYYVTFRSETEEFREPLIISR